MVRSYLTALVYAVKYIQVNPSPQIFSLFRCLGLIIKSYHQERTPNVKTLTKKKKSGLNITPNDVILNIKTMLFWGELTFNRHLINGYGQKKANQKISNVSKVDKKF